MNNIVLSAPLEIKDPKSGFNGYLLRCKAIPDEDCTQSILIREPNNPEYIFRPLPALLADRILMRKAWWHEANKHKKFVCINADMPESMTYDEYVDVFPKDKEQIIAVVKEMRKTCKTFLPSYKVFAIVLHKNQLIERLDGVYVRPEHFHILLYCDKRRSSEENNRIVVA